MPHVALIYEDGSVFDVSLEEDISPSKNLLIKLPDERNDGDNERGHRFGYQDQMGSLYFLSSKISRPITQLQQKSRFHTIAHKYNENQFHPGESLKLYAGTQVGNRFWLFGMKQYGSLCKRYQVKIVVASTYLLF